LQIAILQDYRFTPPEKFPNTFNIPGFLVFSENSNLVGEAIDKVFADSPRFYWMAEYHNACMSKLVKEAIGASDKTIEKINQLASENALYKRALERKVFDEENPLDLSSFTHPKLIDEYILG
jgi:hypothetical protein